MSDKQIKLFRTNDILCLKGEDGEIGEGGFGVVRVGFHEILGTVAVKCSAIKGGRAEKRLVEKKMKKEISHLLTATHNNIVRVYGWSQWSGSIALIMEYLPAGNLKILLSDKDIALTPLLRLRVCKEISAGVAFIHNLFDDKRLVHGDIKPENILMTEDLHCKLGDFGSAQLQSYTGSTTTKNRNQSAHYEYTLLYAAPERLQGIATKLTPSYDTYSVGMTFHLVLAREMPIDVQSEATFKLFIDKVVRGHRPSLQGIEDYIQELKDEGKNHDVTIMQLLKDEMERCWQQNPNNRPGMVEVRDKLCSEFPAVDTAIVQKHVAVALQDLDITKPSFVPQKCAPLDRFQLPDFKTTVERSDPRQNVAEMSISQYATDYSDRSTANTQGMHQEMLQNFGDISVTEYATDCSYDRSNSGSSNLIGGNHIGLEDDGYITVPKALFLDSSENQHLPPRLMPDNISAADLRSDDPASNSLSAAVNQPNSLRHNILPGQNNSPYLSEPPAVNGSIGQYPKPKSQTGRFVATSPAIASPSQFAGKASSSKSCLGPQSHQRQHALAQGWEMMKDDTGRIHYVNRNTEVINWEQPNTLPPGWGMPTDTQQQQRQRQRIHYGNHNTETRTWQGQTPTRFQSFEDCTNQNGAMPHEREAIDQMVGNVLQLASIQREAGAPANQAHSSPDGRLGPMLQSWGTNVLVSPVRNLFRR